MAQNPYAIAPGTPIGAVGEKKGGGHTMALTRLKNSMELGKVRAAAADVRQELKQEPARDASSAVVGLGLGYAGGVVIDQSKSDSYLKNNPGKVGLGSAVVGIGGGYMAAKSGHSMLGKALMFAGTFLAGHSMGRMPQNASAPAPAPAVKGVEGTDPFDRLVAGLAAETGLPLNVAGALAADAVDGLDDPAIGMVLPAAALWAMFQQAVKAGNQPPPASKVVIEGLGYDAHNVGDPAAICRVEGVRERMARQDARKARRAERRARRQGKPASSTAPNEDVAALHQEIRDLRRQMIQQANAQAGGSPEDLELVE